MAAPTQPPFYVPRFEPTYWQGEPVNSTVIQILTAGGEPNHVEWAARTTYVPPPDWVWKAPPAYPLFALVVGGKPARKQWFLRNNYVPPPDWVGKPTATNINTFPVTVAPFSNYCCGMMLRGLAPDQFWLGEPQPTNINTFPAAAAIVLPQAPFWAPDLEDQFNWQFDPPYPTNLFSVTVTQPFSKLWRYDYQPDTAWTGIPIGAPFDMLGGQVPTKQWRYDYDSGVTLWQGVPRGASFNALGGQVPTKPWRWDHVAATNWQGEPVNSAPIQILTAGGQPFSKQWRWDYQPDPFWLGTPQSTNIETFPVTGQPFSKLWRYDYQPDTAWTWDGQPSYTLFALVSGGVPFSKQWRWDHVPATNWQGEPVNSAPIQILTAGGQPFAKQVWRYDYQPEPVWQGKPQPTNVNTFPTGSPFFTQWRYDLTPSPDWVWKPLANSVVRLLTVGGNPAHRQWRYDWDSGAGFWQGKPQSVNIGTLPAAAQPFFRQWRYDWDSGRTWWQGAPIGVHSPIFNPGPPIPPVTPPTTGGGEPPRGGRYKWAWRDFNDRAWLKAFRDEFYRARKRRNAERRREELEELDRILAAATAQPTTIEQKYDLQRAGELLLSTAALGTERYDRLTENLTALAAEIDDEEAFILLSD